MTDYNLDEIRARLSLLEMEMKANTRITTGLQDDMSVLLDILGTAKSGLKVLGGLGQAVKWVASFAAAAAAIWGLFHGNWPK